MGCLSSVVLLAGAAAASGGWDWEEYTKTFHKAAEHAQLSQDLIAARRAAFESRAAAARAISSFATRPNKYSDWTAAELGAFLTLRPRQSAKTTALPARATSDPVDWRDQGAVRSGVESSRPS